MDSQLDPLFEKAINERKVPGIGSIILDASGKVLYKNTFGTINIDDPSAAPFTSSTPCSLMSLTKLPTTIAALQLLEQGKFALDDPVEKYVPEINKIQIHDGFDENGKLKYRQQKTKMTIVHLMTHTAGFSYDFFHPLTLQYRIEKGETPSQYNSGSMTAFESPLVHEPGSAYEYGVNTDWLGFVIEKISGMELSEYIEKHICAPLGLKDTKAYGGFSEEERSQMLSIHFRNAENGALFAMPSLTAAVNSGKNGGGTYLYSNLDDYSQILLTVLNNGTHPTSKVKILDAETVKHYLFEDFVKPICSTEHVGVITQSIPALTNVGTFLPRSEKTWSCGLLVNLQDTEYGRKAMSGAWAGLGSLYYWIDPTEGKLGLIMTSVFPFLDGDVCNLFDKMEKVTYGSNLGGGKMSNFEVGS